LQDFVPFGVQPGGELPALVNVGHGDDDLLTKGHSGVKRQHRPCQRCVRQRRRALFTIRKFFPEAETRM